MRIKTTILLSLIASSVLTGVSAAAEETGQQLALDRNKGNCIACHAIPSEPKVEAAGNIAPPLTAMKARFPDRAKLRAQIWDATAANPDSVMPPFGRNKVLTEQEVDQVTDYIQNLQ